MCKKGKPSHTKIWKSIGSKKDKIKMWVVIGYQDLKSVFVTAEPWKIPLHNFYEFVWLLKTGIPRMLRYTFLGGWEEGGYGNNNPLAWESGKPISYKWAIHSSNNTSKVDHTALEKRDLWRHSTTFLTTVICW